MRYLMLVGVDPSAEPFDPAQDNVEEWVSTNDKNGTRIIGNRLAGLVCWFMDTELYRIPLIIEPATYAFSTTVVLIAALLSGLLVRRRLDHLDLIAVLKTRE